MLPGINREYSRGMTEFVTKRIYELASSDDGYRVLVDRLWPRGVSKEKAVLDETRADQKDQILADLTEYCKLDTWAMVRIWQELLKI